MWPSAIFKAHPTEENQLAVNDNILTTDVDLGSWRFSFNDAMPTTVEVECTTWDPKADWRRMNVPVTPGFRASDLEMFARGWVACRDHV